MQNFENENIIDENIDNENPLQVENNEEYDENQPEEVYETEEYPFEENYEENADAYSEENYDDYSEENGEYDQNGYYEEQPNEEYNYENYDETPTEEYAENGEYYEQPNENEYYEQPAENEQEQPNEEYNYENEQVANEEYYENEQVANEESADEYIENEQEPAPTEKAPAKKTYKKMRFFDFGLIVAFALAIAVLCIIVTGVSDYFGIKLMFEKTLTTHYIKHIIIYIGLVLLSIVYSIDSRVLNNNKLLFIVSMIYNVTLLLVLGIICTIGILL